MNAVASALLASALMCGCASTAVPPKLTRRASFDFQCPHDQLRYEEIDRRSYGILGCNKRATYVESCDGPAGPAKCTWVLNGSIESTEPAPQPSPPGQSN